MDNPPHPDKYLADLHHYYVTNHYHAQPLTQLSNLNITSSLTSTSNFSASTRVAELELERPMYWGCRQLYSVEKLKGQVREREKFQNRSDVR